MLIQFMISEAKKKICIDEPTEEEANKIYDEVTGCVISLNDNRRCESYSLYSSQVRYVPVQKEYKRLRRFQ